jgi:hypothetical protein
MKRNLIAALLAVLTFPGISSAALVQLDAVAAGDGLITRDTATGLEWLDLTATVQQSWVSMNVLLATDPFFSGFRRATGAEVHTLLANAGFATFGTFNAANVPAATFLTGLLGDTMGGLGSRHGSQGLLADTVPGPLPIRVATYFTDILVLGSLSGYGDSPDGVAVTWYAFDDIGHFLVRPVPEPSTMLLVGLGIAAFVRRRL